MEEEAICFWAPWPGFCGTLPSEAFEAQGERKLRPPVRLVTRWRQAERRPGEGGSERRGDGDYCKGGGASQKLILEINFGYDAHTGRIDSGLHPGAAGVRGGEAGGRSRAGTKDSCGEAGVEREPAGPFAESDGSGTADAGGRQLVSGRGKQEAARSAGGAGRSTRGRGFCGVGIERDHRSGVTGAAAAGTGGDYQRGIVRAVFHCHSGERREADFDAAEELRI